ncbi:MAG: molybdopterin-dependent oxidoreductase, partial [Bacteroidales bacterium]|nr:molybdopterin-dependent oxidoreductase [Bacteroidales bacterium]
EEQRAVIVFSEKELSSNACTELQNLSLITGKLGKTGSGLIALKEKNNSQGLHDMGICRNYGAGGVSLHDAESRSRIQKAWKMADFPAINPVPIVERLESGTLKNLFIFGEDPAGCTFDKDKIHGWLKQAGFIVVQDYFMTETAALADLILPASFPVESGGSFTNTQKVIQEFAAHFTPVTRTTLEQLSDLLKAEGIDQSADYHDVLSEIVSLLPEPGKESFHSFTVTNQDNQARLFEHGCDYLVKRFDSEFTGAFENVKTEVYERV